MKKRLLTICFTFSASLILLSGSAPVNSSPARPAVKSGVSQADGVPLPPPTPKPKPVGVITADGVPLPPPTPKPKPGAAVPGSGLSV